MAIERIRAVGVFSISRSRARSRNPLKKKYAPPSRAIVA
jgi:hypothetical protein